LLPALGELDERFQMGNPIKVVTSGVERLAQASFWSGGKWRMCHRVRWWEEYGESIPVVIGHYWRQASQISWMGARSNVFCVDFSVGARYQERKAGITQHETHLAAMRWPEKELWFETGKV
jgi:hypothetical protein